MNVRHVHISPLGGLAGNMFTPAPLDALPVHAPAAALFPEVLPVEDYGIPGECVTPTGAVIAREIIRRATPRPHGTERDRPSVIEFDIDDMTAEEIPTATAHLREAVGLIDVLTVVAAGKKGRITTRFRLLARPEREEAVAAAGAAIRILRAGDLA